MGYPRAFRNPLTLAADSLPMIGILTLKPSPALNFPIW